MKKVDCCGTCENGKIVGTMNVIDCQVNGEIVSIMSKCDYFSRQTGVDEP